MNKSRVQQRKQMGKDDVLDRAGATELATNLFRITQTDEKLILPIWLSEEKLESPSRTLLERTQRKQLAPKFVRGLDN